MKYLIINDIFVWFKKTALGEFIIEKILFKSKNFYSAISPLILILIFQLSALNYGDKLSLKIENQINTSEGFEKFIWYIVDFFAPSGSWTIIIILSLIILILFWLRNKELNDISSTDSIATTGWYTYENWSNPSAGLEEEYIIDDKTIIYNDRNEKKPLLEGLEELRKKLLENKSVIRLVGLSGVGKTRFVQAIFDDRVGVHALDPSIVYYTDMSREPDPSPLRMAETLLEIGERAVLIVDNCSPKLHRELVKTVTREESLISLLTVEYDVKDDLPEETAVFKLEPNSSEVIEKIIERRFPHISQVDRRQIAKFSGGNARIAIALANTVGRSETLAGLRNDDLFERLFKQRHESDRSLIRSAEILSLVYSFNGKDIGKDSELSFLADLAGVSVHELYRNVQELKKRDLVQQRGDWRALLPQAIANRLAKQALELMPVQEITQKFLNCGNKRLITSFAHRLSYLHDSNEAIEIAEKWLAEDGFLGKANCHFNDFGMDLFRYVVPVAPGRVLECMERAARERKEEFLDPSKNDKAIEFVHLLRHIAYEQEYFPRVVELILQFVLHEKRQGHNTIEEILKSLFWMVLSGTHAAPEVRAELVAQLLFSDDETKQNIGFELLESALETDCFSSHYGFDFGARPRDFGWEPKNAAETSRWYRMFIEIAMELALSEHRLSKSVRKLLADRFRGLWNRSANFELLEEVAQRLNEEEPWIEGYLAVKETIRFDKDRFGSEILEKILHIEKLLKPIDLYTKALTYTVPWRYHTNDCYRFENEQERKKCEERLQNEALEIGYELGRRQEIFVSLLPRFITSDNYMLMKLIHGVMETCPNKRKLWNLIYVQYKETPKNEWKLRVIDAILRYFYEYKQEYFNEIMDNLIEDNTFAEVFPLLQIPLLDEKGLQRLHRSLDLQYAPVEYYKNLAYECMHETLDDDQLFDLLNHIVRFDDDLDVVIEILMMCFHGKTRNKHSPNIIKFGFNVLKHYRFEEDYGGNKDHDLEIIAKTCFENDNDPGKAKEICNNFLIAMQETYRNAKFPRLKKVIAHYQPLVFLNCMFELDQSKRLYGFISDSDKESYPAFSEIHDETILEWCSDDVDVKVPFVLKYINPFDKNKNIKPIVFELLLRSENLKSNLDILLDAVTPTSWMGSRANRYETTLLFLEKLESSDIEEIQTWAKLKYEEIVKEIRKIEDEEAQEERADFERFE